MVLSGCTKGCKRWTLDQAPGASPTTAALPPSRPPAVGSCHPQLPSSSRCSILMRSRCYFTLSVTCISQMVMKVKPLFYVGFLTQQITTNFHNLKQDELMIAQSWRSEFQPGSRWARIRVSAGLCSSRSLRGESVPHLRQLLEALSFLSSCPLLCLRQLSVDVSLPFPGVSSPQPHSLPSHQGFLRTHEKASAPPASPRTISPSQIPT